MISQGNRNRDFINNTTRGSLQKHETKRTKNPDKLYHSDYTIGWICALPLELTAAKAVLDEEHAELLNSAGDDNIYHLGSIHGRNVVITCLPSGCYGNNRAATVATNMRHTFPNITASLMVGIGGGVPSSAHEIRLGDVVVSLPRSDFPAVVQYDFGKTEAYGISHPKGSLNKPPTSLLKAVASLQSAHQMGRNQMQAYIREAHETYPLSAFTYPGVSKDILYEAECDRHQESLVCEICGPCKEVARVPRSNEMSVIHYGTIGSGNQVIKHGRTRDRYAKQFDILCFEMEAAGLMDELPSIIIRGICDYCDTFKNKDFQGHAAMTAAAYAKDLLSKMPIQQFTKDNSPLELSQDQDNFRLKQNRWETLIDALAFDEAYSRLDTVKKAHPHTCNWLLGQIQYTEWLNDEKATDHHGLLWIRGKPGTGKSTLMKYLTEHAEKSKAENAIVVSFFFHARGEELQKSTLGMYRSLLSQIFKKAPQLHKPLDALIQQSYNVTWTLIRLQKMFSDVITNLESTSLFCYIDALDECSEEQIRDLLAFWEDLGDLSIDRGIRFRVCLSSRHYPEISIRAGIQFKLEDQEGHSNDIGKYAASELKIIGRSKQAEHIKGKVYTKSGRIFLWVVLVVQILKTEFDRGNIHKLEKRLNEIPMELNELFLDILVRDNKDLPALVLCIQWILFAKKAIRREELYFALLAGDMSDLSALADWDPEELNSKIMDRHILTCSKGLAETTRAKNPSVQFIHESVREFLLQPVALNHLWSGFNELAPGPSHQRLRQCCRLYLDFHGHREFESATDNPNSALTLKEKIHRLYPFLEYATEQLLIHAEEAEKLGFSEAVFITCFDIEKWIKLWNLVQRFQVHKFPSNTNLQYVLAKLKLPYLLIRSIQTVTTSLKDQSAGVEALIGQALDDRNLEAFKVLSTVDHGSIDENESDEARPFTEIFEYLQILKPNKLAEFADTKAFSAAMKLLRNWENRVAMDIVNKVFLDAASFRHAETVQFLLKNGADITAIDENENTALHLVANHRHLPKRKTKNDQQTGFTVEAMIPILLQSGVAINSQNRDGNTALHLALYNSSVASATVLLDKGAEFNIVNNEGLTELHVAIRRKKYSVAKHLLRLGARVLPNPIIDGFTLLQDAGNIDDEDLVRMLLMNNIDVHGHIRRNPQRLANKMRVVA